MFFDQLENLPRYQGVHKNIDTAIEYLMTHDLSSLDLGRYDVDEDRVFFFLQENTLCQEQANSFEFHARYLDLHFLLAGHSVWLSREGSFRSLRRGTGYWLCSL